MSWDDDSFGNEYVKFSGNDGDVLTTDIFSDHTVYSIVGRIYWDTIEDYVNVWNKQRKKVRFDYVRRCINTPYNSDEVIENPNLYLDMGARLYNEIRKHREKKPKFVQINKYENPRDKFDTWYIVMPYKFVAQKKVSTSKTKSNK